MLEMSSRNAQLINAFVGIMVAAIVGGAIAIPVLNTALGTSTNTVANESINSSGSLSEIITVDQAPSGVVEDSENLRFRNATGSLFALNESNHYTPRYDDSEFNITALPGGQEASLTSDDQYLVSYEGKPENFVESDTARLVLGFVTLGIAISIFLASLAPIMGGMGGNGRRRRN